jgi:hypothetical protein
MYNQIFQYDIFCLFLFGVRIEPRASHLFVLPLSYTLCPSTRFWKDIFSPSNCFGALLKIKWPYKCRSISRHTILQCTLFSNDLLVIPSANTTCLDYCSFIESMELYWKYGEQTVLSPSILPHSVKIILDIVTLVFPYVLESASQFKILLRFIRFVWLNLRIDIIWELTIQTWHILPLIHMFINFSNIL